MTHIAWRFVLFGFALFGFLCLYDVTWMKASDFEILPRNIEMHYQLVKLLLYWIPIGICVVASALFFNKGGTAFLGVRRVALLIGLIVYCLGLPLAASVALGIFGCFVYFTYFEACI